MSLVNIFYVDEDPVVAARSLPDAHIRKMPLETVQMLVSALMRHGISHEVMTKAGTLHKGGYKNHPCTIWAGDTRGNFLWLLAHGFALCDEFVHRYGHEHFARTQLETLTKYAYVLPEGVLTPPHLAMPDELKTDNPVESYRACIRWKVESKPLSFDWLKDWTRRPGWSYP